MAASNCVKLFCDLKLNYNIVVCGMLKLIELCYSLAYKECYSIYVYGMVHLWNVCSANVYICIGNLDG